MATNETATVPLNNESSDFLIQVNSALLQKNKRIKKKKTKTSKGSIVRTESFIVDNIKPIILTPMSLYISHSHSLDNWRANSQISDLEYSLDVD